MALCFLFLTERRIILCQPFQLLPFPCLSKLEALTLPLQVLNIKVYQETSSLSVRKVHQQPPKLPFQISGASFIRLTEKKKKTNQKTENPSLLNIHNHFSTRCFTISLTHDFQVCSDFDCYLFARCMSSRMMCPHE